MTVTTFFQAHPMVENRLAFAAAILRQQFWTIVFFAIITIAITVYHHPNPYTGAGPQHRPHHERAAIE